MLLENNANPQAQDLNGRNSYHEAALTAEGLRVLRLEVPDGEAAKKARVAEYLWERLGSFRLGRDGLVVGLGGGATTDLAGFAAATGRAAGTSVISSSMSSMTKMKTSSISARGRSVFSVTSQPRWMSRGSSAESSGTFEVSATIRHSPRSRI